MTYFSFSPITLMKIYSSFCSSSYCHFSGKLIIYTLPKLLSLWAKNCSQSLLQCSRELNVFPMREFCKYWNKWTSEGAVTGEYSEWIRTSQPSYNSFCLVVRETCGLVLSWWKIMCFLLTNSRRFSLSDALSWSHWEQYLLEWIVWFSGRSSY